MRQVFRQPVQLLGGEALDIVAGFGSVVAAAIDVVHDDVMDLADVERIVGRADLIHIFDRRIVVRPGLEVVVMVPMVWKICRFLIWLLMVFRYWGK